MKCKRISLPWGPCIICSGLPPSLAKSSVQQLPATTVNFHRDDYLLGSRKPYFISVASGSRGRTAISSLQGLSCCHLMLSSVSIDIISRGQLGKYYRHCSCCPSSQWWHRITEKKPILVLYTPPLDNFSQSILNRYFRTLTANLHSVVP